MEARADREPRVLAGLIAIAFLCAWLTIAISGHQSGAGNNLFHLPILVRLYDHPNFTTDPFVQSTRYFASGFWMLLRGVADRDSMLELFLPLQVASRFLFFIGVLGMAKPLHIRDWRTTTWFMVLSALAFPLRGYSPAGDGGLLIAVFTHSELGNATTLIALALALRQRFGWAILTCGVTFFINIFMGVWLVPAIGVLALIGLRRGSISIRQLTIQVTWGALTCILLIVPVIANVVSNPDFGKQIGIDYRDFLHDYWPLHFLVDTVAKRDLLALSGLVLAAGAALATLKARTWIALGAILASYAAVWATGAVVPWLTGSPLILNLHLLRSSALIVIVSVLCIAACAARWLTSEVDVDRRFWAPLLALLLIAAPYLVLLTPVVVLARRYVGVPAVLSRPATPIVAAIIIVLLVGSTIQHSVQEDALFRAGQREWLAVATWAHDRTPPTHRFLLPTANIYYAGSLPHSEGAPSVIGSEVFEAAADRPVWVGFKEGAAVMWSPSYYPEWRGRVTDVLRLDNLRDRLAYARYHRIDMVVEHCAPDGTTPLPAYRGITLCVYPAGAAS